MSHKCETCGSSVEIVGETTKHYRPISTNDIVGKLEKRLGAAIEFIKDCSASHIESRYKYRAQVLIKKLGEDNGNKKR